MVPIDVVDPTAVDIDLESKVFCNHGGVLDVPGGSAPTDIRIPETQIPIIVSMPQYEIAPVPTTAVVGILLETNLCFRAAVAQKVEQRAVTCLGVETRRSTVRVRSAAPILWLIYNFEKP